MPTCLADRPVQKETTDREHELAAKLDAYIKTLAEQKDSLDEALWSRLARSTAMHSSTGTT